MTLDELDRMRGEGAVHDLKCWPTPFGAMLRGSKSFEFRKNDRDFNTGDTLHLREWDPGTEQYTGRTLDCLVTYILHSGFGLPDGYCIMSVESAELRKLREENGRLREALRPLAQQGLGGEEDDRDVARITVTVGAIRRARAARADETGE